MSEQIDQTKCTFFLRPVVLKWVFLTSFAAFAILPTIALILYCLAYLCSYGMVIAFYLLIVGLAGWLIVQSCRAQQTNEDDGCAICFVTGVAGFIIYSWHSYLMKLAPQILNFFCHHSELIFSFYMKYHLWGWTWVAMGFVLTCSVINLFLIAFLRITDWIPNLRGVRLICPHPNCFQEEKTNFQCPGCNAVLENVHSSVYGIFAPRCGNCGVHIPSSYLLGRNRMVPVCPECEQLQTAPGFSRFPEATFIIAGGPCSGKTSFLISSFLALQNLPSGRLRSKITFEPEFKNLLEKQKNDFSHGISCPPTADVSRPGAITLAFQRKRSSQTAYFYDSNGFEFTISSKIHPFTFYKNARGIFLVIDPFNEPGFCKKIHARTKNQESELFATTNASAIAGVLCSHLEAVFGLSTQKKCSIPICVVVTKTDLGGAYLEFLPDGFPVLSDLSSISRLTEHSRKVRRFLEECGMHNFLNILDMKFKTVGFFAVTSLGHSPDSPPGTPFESQGVLAPFTWLLAQGANIHVIG